MEYWDTVPLILVVDDQEVDREMIALWLASNGYEVGRVASGEAAIEYIKERPVHLVLLDVQMPGIDGFEVCHQIKTHLSVGYIPVVLVTSLLEEEHRHRAIEVGADDFLTKPVNQTELLVRVHSFLRLKDAHNRLVTTNRTVMKLHSMIRSLRQGQKKSVKHLTKSVQDYLKGLRVVLESQLSELKTLLQNPDLVLTAIDQSTKIQVEILATLDHLIENKADLDVKTKPSNLWKQTTRLIEDFLGKEAKHRGIRLENSLSQKNTDVMVDKHLMQIVLWHLLSASFEKTQEGGTVELTSQAENGILQYRFSMTNPTSQFEKVIETTGPPIEQKKAITSSSKSPMAGFLFCQRVLEAHQGRLEVSSTSENHTIFDLSLPYSREEHN